MDAAPQNNSSVNKDCLSKSDDMTVVIDALNHSAIGLKGLTKTAQHQHICKKQQQQTHPNTIKKKHQKLSAARSAHQSSYLSVSDNDAMNPDISF